MVAFDLRGHGDSGKPDDPAAYQDTALWGDDVKAVINALGLQKPVLVGWSYGARIIASYVATHGDGDISGIVVTGGILALGKHREDWMVGKGSPGRNPDLYSDDDEIRAAATRDFVIACTEEPLDEATTEAFVAFNNKCPAHVRRALFQADFDIQPIWKSLNVPLLVIHGVEDAVVAPICGIEASEIAPNGDLLLYENCGHNAFIEAPERFNADLSLFTQSAIGAAA